MPAEIQHLQKASAGGLAGIGIALGMGGYALISEYVKSSGGALYDIFYGEEITTESEGFVY